MKLITFSLLVTAATWLAVRHDWSSDRVPDAEPPAAADGRVLVDLAPDEATVCLLPSGDPAEIPQLELAFATLASDGRSTPLELKAIELHCELTGWGCFYYVGSRALRLGVGQQQDIRELVPGLTYTAVREGYEPFTFEVPPVRRGECARVDICLVRES